MSIHPALSHLLLWDDGWNGYDALAPQKEAIELASTWLTLYDERREPHWVESPHITGDAWGGVVFWDRAPGNRRHLEIFFNIEGTIDYMQVWDTRDVRCRIDDGEITSPEDFVRVWQWLYEEQEQEQT